MFEVQDVGLRLGFRVKGYGSGLMGLEVRAEGSGLRIYFEGCRLRNDGGWRLEG